MTLEVHPTHESAAARAADLMADACRAGAGVLALPTGRTMVAVYAALVRRPVDWSRVRTFSIDEFATLPPEHPGSFRAFLQAHLLGRLKAPPLSEILRGDAPDLATECARYEALIATAGGIDLALLGVGANGHVGFNEPADALHAATHVVQLHDDTRRANADRFGGEWPRVPDRALTLGMRLLLQARRVMVVATGPAKIGAVAAAIDGPLTTHCPASWLQVHPDVTWVLDAAAAQGLTRRARHDASEP